MTLYPIEFPAISNSPSSGWNTKIFRYLPTQRWPLWHCHPKYFRLDLKVCWFVGFCRCLLLVLIGGETNENLPILSAGRKCLLGTTLWKQNCSIKCLESAYHFLPSLTLSLMHEAVFLKSTQHSEPNGCSFPFCSPFCHSPHTVLPLIVNVLCNIDTFHGNQQLPLKPIYRPWIGNDILNCIKISWWVSLVTGFTCFPHFGPASFFAVFRRNLCQLLMDIQSTVASQNYLQYLWVTFISR